METLSEKISQKKKKKPKAANPDGFSSIINTASVHSKFLNSTYEDGDKTITDKTMKKGLHEKGKYCKNPGARSVASTSDINLEEEDDLESTMKADDEARAALPPPPDPLQMMNLVVRTLTQVFPKVKYHLQFYIEIHYPGLSMSNIMIDLNRTMRSFRRKIIRPQRIWFFVKCIKKLQVHVLQSTTASIL